MTLGPSLSTDQIAALVELARQGSLRAAADVLHITEQGVRNRLLALEARLGVELYRKRRGVRRGSPLTGEGQQFLPHAIAFLDRAGELCQMFSEMPAIREVDVVASQYLLAYVLLDAVRRFHAANPEIRVRLSARTEQEIELTLLTNPNFEIGVAAPYESTPDLLYHHLFSMNWYFIAPRRHAKLKSSRLKLADLADEPMILYEQGSTGRQHVIEGFGKQGVTPRVEMEATNTDIILRMVEAGLGISIVPLPVPDNVTRGRRVATRSLGRQIRPIHSGILTRKGQRVSAAASQLIDFLRGNL